MRLAARGLSTSWSVWQDRLRAFSAFEAGGRLKESARDTDDDDGHLKESTRDTDDDDGHLKESTCNTYIR